MLEQSFFVKDLLLLITMMMFLTSFYVARFKISFSEAVPISPISITIFLFLFGVLGILKVGLYLANFTIILLFIYSLFLIKKDPKTYIKNLFSPGLVIYLICCCLVYIFFNGAKITSHDDFNHWAIASKLMFLKDSIPVGEDFSTAYQDYPPAVALFQYWTTKIKGNYCESIVLFSMSLWGYALIVSIAKNLSWKYPLEIFSLTLLVFIFPVIFVISMGGDEIYYQYSMVDYLLALSFGYSLSLAVKIRKRSQPIQIFNLIISLIALAMIKKVGFFLSFIVLLISIYNILYDDKALLIKDIKKLLRNYWKILVIISLPLIATIFIWDLFLDYRLASISYINRSFEITVENIVSFNIDLPQRTKDIMLIYIKALFEKNIINSNSIHISFLFFILILNIAFFVFYKMCNLNEELKKRAIGNYKLIILSFLVFMMGHILMYVFILSDGESQGLSSFLRYLLPFSAGIVLFLVSLFLMQNNIKKGANKANFFIVILVFFAIFPSNIKKFINYQGISKQNLPKECIEKSEFISKKECLKVILENELNSKNHTHRGWAKKTLENVNNENYEIGVNMEALKLMILIEQSRQNKRINEDYKSIAKSIKNNFDYKKLKEELCIFEGRPGSGYGHALTARYEFAPLKIGLRYIAAEASNEQEISWRKQHFSDVMKKCSYVFVVEPNNILRNEYKQYFRSKILQNALYKKQIAENDNFYFTIIK